MHLSAGVQVRAHVDHVRARLPAGWRDIPIASHPSPEALGYRSRAYLHVRAETDRRGQKRVTVGMHEARTHHPVEVDSCAVLDPALERARGSLASIFEGCRGRGDVKLALGAERLPVLDVRWRGYVAPETFARLDHAVGTRVISGAGVTIDDATRPAKIGDPTPWMAGPDGLPLRLAAGGFGQASERMNVVLAAHVAELVRGLLPGKTVELYAGAGNLSVVLAREVSQLTCVESSREACEAARANLAVRALRARVVEADADRHAWGPATGIIVLDPPRTGARVVAERLAASPVPHVVYVSCDTATLGRDLAILERAYAPRSVSTFEMFPQTSHIEIVVSMTAQRRLRDHRP